MPDLTETPSSPRHVSEGVADSRLRPKSLPSRRRRAYSGPMSKAKLKMVPVWILQILLAVAFLPAGGSKLPTSPIWTERFRTWGYPDHFYIVIGVVEVLGAIALVIPRAAGYGAATLSVVMIGACVTHLLHGERQAITTAVFLLLLAVVAYVRRSDFLQKFVRR